MNLKGEFRLLRTLGWRSYWQLRPTLKGARVATGPGGPPRSVGRLPQDVDVSGTSMPDLDTYRHLSAGEWYERYVAVRRETRRTIDREERAFKGRQAQGQARETTSDEEWKTLKTWADDVWARRTEATWGLISGGLTSIPFAVQMVRSSDSETRADGAGVLRALGRQSALVPALADRLAVETDSEALVQLIFALGRIGDRRALAPLRTLLLGQTDPAIRDALIDAVGRIARKRFSHHADPYDATVTWLSGQREFRRDLDSQVGVR